MRDDGVDPFFPHYASRVTRLLPATRVPRHGSEKSADASVAVAGRLAPDARERLGAVWAQAVGADTVLEDEEAHPLDHHFAAVVAARVLEVPHPTGQIAGIEVSQARLPADLDDLEQVVGLGLAVAVGHLVVGVERRH